MRPSFFFSNSTWVVHGIWKFGRSVSLGSIQVHMWVFVLTYFAGLLGPFPFALILRENAVFFLSVSYFAGLACLYL